MARLGMVEKLSGKDDLIFVLNSGSSSLKFGVYCRGASDEAALLSGSADGIGAGNGTLQVRSGGKSLVQREGILESQSDALATVAEAIRKHICAAPVAVGHRVVHGGPHLLAHQLITPQVLDELRSCVHFAPVHIPTALRLITAAEKAYPEVPQFACFDTAFHTTIPEVGSRFALPRPLFDEGIHRYGFHGLSYESIVYQLGPELPTRTVIAHLGNGASLAAVKGGHSVDTSMGLTPTGGIPMATRSGDLDPGVLLYLLRNEHLSADELEQLLNRQCGLFALSNGESDMQALLQRESNDPTAALAIDAFCAAIRKSIGAYAA